MGEIFYREIVHFRTVLVKTPEWNYESWWSCLMFICGLMLTVDYASCRKHGISYRALPSSYEQPVCTGRTLPGNEVCNEVWTWLRLATIPLNRLIYVQLVTRDGRPRKFGLVGESSIVWWWNLVSGVETNPRFRRNDEKSVVRGTAGSVGLTWRMITVLV